MAGNIAPIDWPATFAVPAIAPHTANVSTGVVRSKMQAGNTRQRRLFHHMPTLFNVAWRMNSSDMREAMKWLHSHGFDWFNLPIVSTYAAQDNLMLAPLAVRLVSDIDIVSLGHGYWEITATVELSPDVYRTTPQLQDDWIIAQTPVAPSSPDWYVAGDPDSPSTPDWVLAGTPAAPNAIV